MTSSCFPTTTKTCFQNYKNQNQIVKLDGMLIREDIAKADAREKRMLDTLRNKVFNIDIEEIPEFSIEERIARNKLYILAELAKTEQFLSGFWNNQNEVINFLENPPSSTETFEQPKENSSSSSRDLEESNDFEITNVFDPFSLFSEASLSPLREETSPETSAKSTPRVLSEFVDWSNTPCSSTDPLFIQDEDDYFDEYSTPAANSPEYGCQEQKIRIRPIQAIKPIVLQALDELDMDVLLEEEFQEIMKKKKELEQQEEIRRKQEVDELMNEIAELEMQSIQPEITPRNQGVPKIACAEPETPVENRISFRVEAKGGPPAKKLKFCPRVRQLDSFSDDDSNLNSQENRRISSGVSQSAVSHKKLQNVSKLIEEFEEAVRGRREQNEKIFEEVFREDKIEPSEWKDWDYLKIPIEKLEQKYEWPFGNAKGVYWPVTVPSIDRRKSDRSIQIKHMEQLMKDHTCSGSYLTDFLLVDEDSSKTPAEQFLQNHAVSGSDTSYRRNNSNRRGKSEWEMYDEIEGGRFANRKPYKTNSTNQTRQMAYEKYDTNQEKERIRAREYWETPEDNSSKKLYMKDCVKSHQVDRYSPRIGPSKPREAIINYKWTVDLNRLKSCDRDERLGKMINALNKNYDRCLKDRKKRIDWKRWYAMPMAASLFYQSEKSNFSVSQENEAKWDERKTDVKKLLSKRLSLNMPELRKLCKLTEADKKVWTILYENLSAHFDDFPMLSQILENPDRVQVLDKVFKKKFPRS